METSAKFDIHYFAEHFVCFGIPKQQMTIIWVWKLTNLSKIPLTVVLLLLVGRVLQMWKKKIFQDVEQTHLKRMRHEMKVVVGRLLDRLFACDYECVSVDHFLE